MCCADESHPVFSSFMSLYQTRQSTTETLCPSVFKLIVDSHSDLFPTGQQHDAQEFAMWLMVSGRKFDVTEIPSSSVQLMSNDKPSHCQHKILSVLYYPLGSY